MTILFWIALVIDAIMMLILLVLGLSDARASDGGREMGLIFSVIIPAVVVAGAALLFLKSESTARRAIALVIVAGPGLFIAGARLRSALIDRQVKKNAQGSGYFSGKMASAGEAVVKGDLTSLRAMKSSIDVNAHGTRGMTLMQLAVEQVYDPTPRTGGMVAPLAMVRAMLDLGASANDGLAEATRMKDPALLRLLLDAKANPNFTVESQPVVFEWLGVTTIAHLTLLIDHGLNLNIANSSETPLLSVCAQADRWDMVRLLIARGVDVSKADREKRTVYDLIVDRLASPIERTAEVKAELLQLKAQLERATPKAALTTSRP